MIDLVMNGPNPQRILVSDNLTPAEVKPEAHILDSLKEVWDNNTDAAIWDKEPNPGSFATDSAHGQPIRPEPSIEGKTAFEILKNRYLLIEDDKTCECHTHLVIEAMEAYASQRNRISWPEESKIDQFTKSANLNSHSPYSAALLAIDWLKKEVEGKRG